MGQLTGALAIVTVAALVPTGVAAERGPAR
jgi:hypothetical protein